MTGAVHGSPRLQSMEHVGQDRLHAVFRIDGQHPFEADFTIQRNQAGRPSGMTDDSRFLHFHALNGVQELRAIVQVVVAFCLQAQGEEAAAPTGTGSLPAVGTGDVLAGIEKFAWSSHHDAYGTADEMPDRIRALLSPVPAERDAALEELWGTVWHQGTVYDCTPRAAQFLAKVAGADSCDPATRVQVLLLLASVASADSFVLPDKLGPGHEHWARLPVQPADRELDAESRGAVAAAAPGLAAAAQTGGLNIQAATLAVLAATGTAVSARALVTELERRQDPRLASAAVLTRLLGEGGLEELPAAIQAGAALDDEARDHLDSIRDEPVELQARELVRELVERFLSS